LLRNLSKFITQTGLYCNKQLETTFHQFCEKPLHITFKLHSRRPILLDTDTLWTESAKNYLNAASDTCWQPRRL